MIVPDEIKRTRRRTLAISLSEDGKLTVHAPMRCKDETIERFLKEKERWIERNREKIKRAEVFLPPENTEGYSFLLDGKRVSVQKSQTGKSYLLSDTLFLDKTDHPTAVAFLKKYALKNQTEEIGIWSEKTGLYPKSVKVSGAKTRWGSCSGQNAITFSFRLVYAPKEVQRYVVIHELVHIRYKNHSPAFWREVEKFDPLFAVHRKWLKDHAYLMRIF